MDTQHEAPNATDILATRAVLSGLSISVWGATALDRKVTQEAINAQEAQSDAGKFTKHVIARHAIEPIQKAASVIRRLHYQATLPWTDEGLRVLPVANAPGYDSKLKEAVLEFNAQVDSFVANYDSHVAEARARLGKMYNPADYPFRDRIREKFEIRTRLVPIPSADDFRCQMGLEALNAARAALEESNRLALLTAMKDAWRQAREVVEAMALKLKAYHPGSDGERPRGIFRDTLVTNVIEIAERLPGLNIASDARLAALAETVGDKLTYYSAEELRNDEGARTVTQGHAEAILAHIDAALASL